MNLFSCRRQKYQKIIIYLFCYLVLCVTEGSGKERKEDGFDSIGTILFEDHGFMKKCFTQQDIALLSTRLKFQTLLPLLNNLYLENDDAMESLIKYFFSINEMIGKMSNAEVKQLVDKAFYDMLGSYLKHYVLPVTKYSFYTGNITYTMALNVYSLYEKCKILLDTNGNGWSEPINDFSRFNLKIEPLIVTKHDKGDEDDEMKACVNLMLNQDDNESDEDMLVSLPKMEAEENEELATIWLPLRRKHIFNLNSKTSAFILFRYFVAVSKCYNYQGVSQVAFNRKLRQWIIDKVLPYLDDTRLYPAFGAVLRILETVKQPKEPDYRGSKRKHKSPQPAISSSSDVSAEAPTRILDRLFSSHQKNEDGSDFLDNSNEHDNHVKEMIQYSIIGIAIGLFLIVALICVCKTVKNRANMKIESSQKKPKKSKKVSRNSSRPSFKDKFYNVFRKPEDNDESDYYHKKDDLSSSKSHVMFENENGTSSGTMRKSKQRQSQKPLMLPIIDSESDSDGEYMTHKMDLSGNNAKKSLDQGLFRISEESEISPVSSKHSSNQKLVPRNPSRTKSQPSSFFNKLKRSKSPNASKMIREAKDNASGSG